MTSQRKSHCHGQSLCDSSFSFSQELTSMLSNGSGQFGHPNTIMAPYSGPLLSQLPSSTIEASETCFEELLYDDSLLSITHPRPSKGLASVTAGWQVRAAQDNLPASSAASTGSWSRQSTGHRSAAVEDQNGSSEQWIGGESVLPRVYAISHEPWDHDLTSILLWKMQALVTPSTASDPKFSTVYSPQIMNLATIELEADECEESSSTKERVSIPQLSPGMFDLESLDTQAGRCPANPTPPVHSRTHAQIRPNFRHTEEIEYDTSTFSMYLNGQSAQNNEKWSREVISEPIETQLQIYANGNLRDTLQPVPIQIPLPDPQVSEPNYTTIKFTDATDLFDSSQTGDLGRTCHDVFDTGSMGQFATKRLLRPHHNNTISKESTASPGSTSVAAFRCPHASCSSKVLFTRKCDLDKHYRLHFRTYFCRFPDCESSQRSDQRTRPRFATMKDRNRHEKGHNPSLPCHVCGHLFGRYDNMRDHCRRRHGDHSLPTVRCREF